MLNDIKGLTQPLQIDMANPRPARHRVLGATTVATVTAAAAVRYPAAASNCSFNEYTALLIVNAH